MKIYTRTGDDGTTGLFNGQRVSKTHLRVEACGAVDEVNSLLGVAQAAEPQPAVAARLAMLQATLFVLGADLATPPLEDRVVTRVRAEDTAWLEDGIDEMTRELPELRRFILPGGTEAAARIHVARAVCRRAERDARRAAEVESITPEALVYLNRLSDFLFTLARHENFLAGRPETEWSPAG